ncbi:MAG: phosphatase PAP2 family protein [Clostridia bacterium]
MDKKRLLFIILNCLAFAILLGLLVLATFVDLELSKAIGDQSNFFGKFFAVVAEYPSYFLLPICATIIFYNASNFDKKKTRIAIRIFGGALVFFGWFFFAYAGEKFVVMRHEIIFSLCMSAVFGSLSLVIGKFIPKETMTRLLKFAVFCIVFLAVALAVTQTVKSIWSRMRFRDMLKEGNLDGFTPWYSPVLGRQNKNPNYKYTSFPSGHSSSIVHIFVWCVVCDILPSWKSKKWLKPTLWSTFTVFCVLGCFSRIVNCAHFLSDIVVGAGLSYGIFLALRYLFFYHKKFTFGWTDRKLAQLEEKKKLSQESKEQIAVEK